MLKQVKHLGLKKFEFIVNDINPVMFILDFLTFLIFFLFNRDPTDLLYARTTSNAAQALL